MSRSSLHAFGLVLCFVCGCGQPALLVDESGLLQRDSQVRISNYLSFVHDEYGIDYRVVVELLDGAPTELRASNLFERRKIGGELEGRGLLLLVDPINRRVRVEVGYALEPYITDLDASRMLTDYLAPYFDSGQFGPGIEASTEALVNVIQAEPGGRLTSAGETPGTSGSGGAGATRHLLESIHENILSEEAKAELRRVLVPQKDPRSARELELAMLGKGLYYKEVTLYDEAWQQANRPTNWSPARLKEIARQWSRPYEVVEEGAWAVAYYDGAVELGPTFLQKSRAGWIIDASATAEAIIYDYSNENWYVIDGDYPYLGLLHRVLPLRRVTLKSGQRAWMIESGS